MSKKLNIIEAMKMPIGTEFKVDFYDGFINKVENKVKMVNYINGKKLIWSNDKEIFFIDKFVTATFIPIQQPVSFMEVVKTKRKVKVECEGYFKVHKYRCLHEILQKIIDNNFGEEDKALNNFITKGKWYIEESESDSDE